VNDSRFVSFLNDSFVCESNMVVLHVFDSNSTFTVRIYIHARCIHFASVDPDVCACPVLMS